MPKTMLLAGLKFKIIKLNNAIKFLNNKIYVVKYIRKRGFWKIVKYTTIQ